MGETLIDSEILSRLKEALMEDIGEGDLTTSAVVPAGLEAEGRVVAKQEGVFCGFDVFKAVFELMDESLDCTRFVEEGEQVASNTLVAKVTGEARQILHGERLALNLLGRMCGIATLTHAYLEKMNAPSVTLLDTRKTVPLWRALDKYAVRCGGAKNHRTGLYDMILIKENHIALGGGIEKAIEAAKRARPEGVKIEIEVQNIHQLKRALTAGPDMVLLDNFSVEELKKAAELCSGRVQLEASGGITQENIAEIAATGVDRISVGALTHSPKAFDLSMLIEPAKDKE